MFKIIRKKKEPIVNIIKKENIIFTQKIEPIIYTPKLYFITFGGGGTNFYKAVERLTTQAKSLNIFDKIIGYTDKDLKEDTEFWKQHSNFILNKKRGYGYWIWKSYLIKITLEIMNDNDILIYLDSGCEIDIKKKEKFIECIDYIKKNNIVCTDSGLFEKKYTKMDLLNYLNCNSAIYYNTIQLQAGAIGLKKCDIIKKFVDEWYDTCYNYSLIDDSPSKEKNLSEFIENRHDQSVFSLLFKKYKFISKLSMNICIEYIRNRSGNSKLKNEN